MVAKSCLTLAIPWTLACQAPLSMGFTRQENGGEPLNSFKCAYILYSFRADTLVIGSEPVHISEKIKIYCFETPPVKMLGIEGCCKCSSRSLEGEAIYSSI